MVCTLINHRNDIKMFKTQAETQATGEWFHRMVIPMVNKSTGHGNLLSINLFFTITLQVLTSISIEVSQRITHARKRKIAPPSPHFHGLYSYRTYISTNQHVRNHLVKVKTYLEL